MIGKQTIAALFLLCLAGAALAGSELALLALSSAPPAGERSVQDLTLAVSGSELLLSWSPHINALSYKVYSAAEPGGVFQEATNGTFNGTGWTAPLGSTRRFYYVTAVLADVSPGMIYVEGGTFNNSIGLNTVSSFQIGRYEVTQAEFLATMGYVNSHPVYGQGPEYPVYSVSWFTTLAYCNLRSSAEGLSPCYTYTGYGTNPTAWPASLDWSNFVCDWTANGYRLPTEMEWMHAAMGGIYSQGYIYSGSNSVTEAGWTVETSGWHSHPVGTKLPNELGIYDMTGNLFEWLWDCWGPLPVGTTNYHGSGAAWEKIKKGGGWDSDATYSHVWDRLNNGPDYYSGVIGFRVCRIYE